MSEIILAKFIWLHEAREWQDYHGGIIRNSRLTLSFPIEFSDGYNWFLVRRK